MVTVSISDARNNFSDLVNQVAYGHNMIIIEKMNKPVAALVNIQDAGIANLLKNTNTPPSKTAGAINIQKPDIKKVFEAIKNPYDRKSLLGR